jgi:4-amino-4-deoxy-L-arabinose transferase-like glycosyltransferase
MRFPWILALALIAFFLIGWRYVQTPMFSFPDETAHVTYVRYLVERQSLPSFQGPADFWEAHQPPLAYLVMAGPIAVFPKLDLPGQVLLLRLLNLLMGAGTVVVLWGVFRALFKGWVVPQLAAAAVALLPMFNYISAGVNNDNLANLLSAIALLLLLKALERTPSRSRLVLIGCIVTGLLLTKVSAYPLAALLWSVIVWRLIRERRGLYDWIALNAPLVIAVAWFVRNVFVYGDLFGWKYVQIYFADQYQPMFESHRWVDWLRTSWRSTLGILGQFTIALKPWFYRAFEILGLLAGVGLVVALLRRRFSRQSAWLLLILALVTLGSFVYSLKFYQPQGRYLFPALGPLVSLMILGVSAFVPRSRLVVSVGLVVLFSLASLNGLQAVERQVGKSSDAIVTTNLLAPDNRWAVNGERQSGETAYLPDCSKGCLVENVRNFPPSMVLSRVQSVRLVFDQDLSGSTVRTSWLGMVDTTPSPRKQNQSLMVGREVEVDISSLRDDYLKVLRIELGAEFSDRRIERITVTYRPID